MTPPRAATTRKPAAGKPGGRNASTNGTRTDRPLPYDENAEAALLGGALLSRRALETVATVTRPEDFHVPAHAHIAAALGVAFHAGWETVDAVTIHAELVRVHLAGDDTLRDLMSLAAQAPSFGPGLRYATIIRSLARDRRLKYAGEDLVAAIDTADPALRDAAIERLAALTGDDHDGSIVVENIAEALADTSENEPTILTRADGKALLYAACVNVIQSEPGVGKSWVALLGSTQVMETGGTVVYLDYEDTVRRIARRLVTLGAKPSTLIDRFRYIHPSALTTGHAAQIRRLVEADNADLVVIDGVADAIAAQGLEENSASDVLTWWDLLPRPLAATGACVLLLDHVVKSKENRGRWARGNGAKLGALDGVCYMLEAVDPLSRQRAGRLRLIISKDRHGHVGPERAIAAFVQLNPHDQGQHLDYTVDEAPAAEQAAWAGPTDCMETIRRLFTEQPAGELSRSGVETQLKANYGSTFRRATINEALERLALEGDLTVRTGPRNGRYYRAGAFAETLEFDDEEPF